MGKDEKDNLFKKTYIGVAERYSGDPVFKQTYLKLGERYVSSCEIFKEACSSEEEEKDPGTKKTFKVTRKGD